MLQLLVEVLLSCTTNYRFEGKLKSLEDSILLKQDTLQGNNNAVISSSCSPNDSVHSQKPYFIPSLTNTPIDLTSLLGINPVASDTETINFYRGYNGTTDKEPLQKRNHGPLSWIALTKSDNAMRTLWAHIHIEGTDPCTDASYFRQCSSSRQRIYGEGYI